MSNKEFIKEDIIKLLGGATSTLGILKEEIEEKVKDRVEKLIYKLELINKKDFLIVKEMAEKSRIENEELLKKIIQLEKKISLLNKNNKKKSANIKWFCLNLKKYKSYYALFKIILILLITKSLIILHYFTPY